jgi:hypothetical protein
LKSEVIDATMPSDAVWERVGPMNKDIKPPRPPKEQKPPNRPSYEHVMENLDKWANSPGLQPPK